MGEFVHLHLHSEYSLLDGACRIADIPRKAVAEGHHAVAITDHGVMYGAVAFYRACRAAGVKPIIGCEVYVAPRSRFDREGRQDASGQHLILLVRNAEGYRNLIAMVSRGFTEGFYAKPRIDMELLSQHGDGLIALSACLAGCIPQRILAGDMRGAEEYACRMREIFGQDGFYLEVQDHGIPEERRVAEAIREISGRTGIGMVATNDVHYLEKADADKQALMMCIQTGNVISDGRPIGFETDEYYYKSSKEMSELFGMYPGAIENTVRIADLCNYEFVFGQTYLPTYALPEGETHGARLASLSGSGFRQRVARGYIDFSAAPRAQYEERLSYELSVIDRMGYNAYFLIVQDFVAYAKRHGIPVGPGRGSGAGSLVAYCIGITDIDPLQYNLLFERFLNPERVSLPDFDIDFCYDRRGEVIEYVRQRYGADHVAQIVTFGRMAARGAVRDVGRALGMPYSEVDAVARLIPHGPNVTIREAMNRRELRALCEGSSEVRRLIDTAMALEGMPRHASTHAAGIVITEQPVSYYVPLSVNGDTVVTQYDMDTDAALGLVKFDFLGLRYLTIIADAEREIRRTEPDFLVSSLPTDDRATYSLLSSGATDGIFQLESAGMRQLLMQMKPRNLEDIIAAIALYRPGPMDSIPRYIACRNGEEQVHYAHPALADILGVTNGCIVYQEQVMQICRELAGYSFAHADVVRRAMAKKKPEVMEAERALFEAGAQERGIPPEIASEIFDEMVSFASYAFNKSHAAAYALTCYRTAYLKAHYPAAYMAALMTSVFGDSIKLGEYISECQRKGIAVLSPDINESDLHFTVAGDHIRFGLLALRGVGRQFIEQILTERKKGAFTGLQDFIERMSVGDMNRRQVEALIKSGAFDRLGVFRSRLLSSYEKIMDAAIARSRSNLTGQLDLFGTSDEKAAPYPYPELPEFSKREKMLLEKESTGMSFSGHLLDEYEGHIACLPHESVADILRTYDRSAGISDKYADKQKLAVVGIITRRVNKNTRGGGGMAFLTLEDRYASMELVAFPKVLESSGEILTQDRAIWAEGTLSLREDEDPKLLLSRVLPLQHNADPVPGPDGRGKKELRLYLKLPALEGELCRQILELAQAFPGSMPLILYGTDKRRYVTPGDIRVAADEAFLARLRALLGDGNVVVC